LETVTVIWTTDDNDDMMIIIDMIYFTLVV